MSLATVRLGLRNPRDVDFRDRVDVQGIIAVKGFQRVKRIAVAVTVVEVVFSATSRQP
jgi:hypothetical protein